MKLHAFVDESKKHGLVLVAALVASRDRGRSRAVMRQLRLPGHSQIHLYKERRGRRGEIVTAICTTKVVINVYDASVLRNESEARAACLRQIVQDLAAVRAETLFIEQDDSPVGSDRAVVYDAIRKVGAREPLRYVHLRPNEEPLLWVADAVAWCWTHGPEWRRPIQPVVRNVWRV